MIGKPTFDIPSKLSGDDLHFSLYFLHERRLVLRFVLGTLCVRRSARMGVRIRRLSLAMLRIQRRALHLYMRQTQVNHDTMTSETASMRVVPAHLKIPGMRLLV